MTQAHKPEYPYDYPVIAVAFPFSGRELRRSEAVGKERVAGLTDALKQAMADRSEALGEAERHRAALQNGKLALSSLQKRAACMEVRPPPNLLPLRESCPLFNCS